MKKALTTALAVLLALVCGPGLFAQGYVVKGVVVDALGPVIGATVMEKGTTNGTSTGLDGDYSLTVSAPEATVEVSCIGYAAQSFAASAVPATVTLVEDTEFLDDVVVIGYGSLSKKELSSSIVQVDKDDLFKGGMNNPMEMLTGKVAGLNIVTTAAANPNAGSSLQIRGATSISASNDPLVVIDGVPGGDIRNVSPQDIESMTVLKDAASAAIYGTRGANGVILITTKKGSGSTENFHISYDSYFAYNAPKDIPSVLSPDEFRRSRRGTDYGASTDWYRSLLRKFSYEQNQYVSIDASTEKGNYNASVFFKNATGLDLVDARMEYGGRASVEQKFINGRLQANASLSARRVDETYGNDGMFDTALSMNPTMPIWNEDGSFYQPASPTDALNPYEAMVNRTSDGHRIYLLATAGLKWNILMRDNMQLSTSVNYTLDYNDYKSNYWTPSDSGESYWGGYDGHASISYQKWQTNHLEWLGNYGLYLPNHTLQAVLGYRELRLPVRQHALQQSLPGIVPQGHHREPRQHGILQGDLEAHRFLRPRQLQLEEPHLRFGLPPRRGRLEVRRIPQVGRLPRRLHRLGNGRDEIHLRQHAGRPEPQAASQLRPHRPLQLRLLPVPRDLQQQGQLLHGRRVDRRFRT